eukprot:CAMPEP_0182428950 /NCGR_PEP_ID=MMETSP1167-20130531/24900_1 /TAXON_ID=2988 /ORGANISM="Mallomonas Sp, Strain CCMP3275" /LENGTH=870 /DNA_ID=CAMNT_0024612197 /DNA_START=370 /DNA_END=2985 /DNA_ORIENTATION=+
MKGDWTVLSGQYESENGVDDDFPSTGRLCRAGDDLATFDGVSLGDCQNICLVQGIVDYTFSNGICLLRFNLFSYVSGDSTEIACERTYNDAIGAECNSIQFTPDSSNFIGLCNLKIARSGALLPCENPRTSTYDFNCNTQEPTVTPTIAPSRDPTHSPTSGETAPPVCFKFMLLDHFGDGWDKGRMYLYDIYGVAKSYAPNCTDNVREVIYCFPSSAVDGDWVSAAVFGFRPAFWWEMFWQVLIPGTGALHTGKYDTSMRFILRTPGHKERFVQLNVSENTLPNHFNNCNETLYDTCITGKSDDDKARYGSDDKYSGGYGYDKYKSVDGYDETTNSETENTYNDRSDNKNDDKYSSENNNDDKYRSSSGSSSKSSYVRAFAPTYRPVPAPTLKPTYTPSEFNETLYNLTMANGGYDIDNDKPKDKPKPKPKPKPQPDAKVSYDDVCVNPYYTGNNENDGYTYEQNKYDGFKQKFSETYTVNNRRLQGANKPSHDLRAFIASGDTEEALSLYSHAISSDTDSPRIIRSLANRNKRVLSDVLLPRVNLKGHEDIWFRSDGLGTFYTISDTSGQERYRYGTMCGNVSRPGYNAKYEEDENIGCVLGFAPGTYTFRVTGAEDPHKEEVEWTFCQVHGDAQDELVFKITSGCECEPVYIRAQCEKPQYIEDEAEVKICMKYNVHPRKHHAGEESQVMTSVMKEIVKGTCASDCNANITGFRQKEFDEDTLWNRRLQLNEIDDSIVHEVTISMRLQGAIFGIDMSSSSALRLFEEDMRSYVIKSISNGVLPAMIRSEALSQDVDMLKETNFMELVSLEVRHLTKINKEESVIASSVLLVSALAGLVFGVAMLISYYRLRRSEVSYEKLPKELDNFQ